MSGLDDRSRVKHIFQAALDRAPEERAAFLQATCAGDTRLRAEVESLLAAHRQAGHFAERPALAAVDEPGEAPSGLLRNSAERALHDGDRIGAYQVQSRLGAGGMGEVYRAHDTRLGRDVAIKVLPAAFVTDRERLARFEREARLLAALNHPHIGAIHGVENVDGVPALVLELVEGDTLAERIARGPLSITDALPIARQIAEALEVAHEKGIIHRDLKPANIKITPDGRVKVLDFGLAKAATGNASGPDPSKSPTIGGTRDGVLLGTAAYMSPEQARGKPVDKRADIWAFGCVLYEMLTGRMAFPGETLSDTIAAILERGPDWRRLPETTPHALRKLMGRCLEKEPKQRLHDIADARLEIDEMLAAPKTTTVPRPVRWHRTAGWGLALVTAAVFSAGIVWRLKPQSFTSLNPAPVTRFTITPPPGEALSFIADPGSTTLALSPDGRYLAYVAGSRMQIYLRAVDQFDSKPLPGTAGADAPFFSPDGQWLGFFADEKLKKVSLAGGPPVTLCPANGSAFGASWAPDGAIVFAPSFSAQVPGTGLLRVSSDGGVPAAATGRTENEGAQRWPEVLPDGKTVLYSAAPVGGTWSTDATIYVHSLDTGGRRAVVKGVAPHYLATGHVVFSRSGTLFAVPFDVARLAVTGDPVPVIDGVQQTDVSGPQVSLSKVGSVAYIPAVRERQHELVWVDRTGLERPLKAPNRHYLMPRLSPDGKRLAVVIVADTADLWLYDLSRDTLSRLTSEWNNNFPVWTRDGRRLAYARGNLNLNGVPPGIYWKPADGSGPEERLLATDRPSWPFSWSPDGRVLAFMDFDSRNQTSADYTRSDIWWFSLDDGAKPHPFLQTKSWEGAPAFSPDGHWLAYVSDESGRYEIYVRAFPGLGGKWQISTDGGNEPVWPAKGHEIFFRSRDAMMAVEVTTHPTFSPGKPRPLFSHDYDKPGGVLMWPAYDVTADGQRFVLVKTVEDRSRSDATINVVVNWTEELQRRVPARTK